MISSLNYKITSKKSSQNGKKQLCSQKQVKPLPQSDFSQVNKIKARVGRQKPLKKDDIRNLSLVKNNLKFEEQIKGKDLSFISKNQKDKIKINIKKTQEYFLKVNSNGFSLCPPSLQQLIPPILIVSMIVEMISVTLQCIKNYQMHIIFGIMGLLLILIAYFWYKTTSICPTDSIQLQHLQFIKQPKKSSFQPGKHKNFCNLCKTFIGPQSFHCNKCNRCVEYFDHHCKWINNCIGSKNYIEFIHLLVWSWLFMVFFFICNGISIHKMVNENDQLPGTLWYSVTMIVIVFVPFVALSILLSLHLYLMAAKRTTLEMILESRKRTQIHPQISLVTKKAKQLYVPDESPVNSPANFTQNSSVNQTNEQHNQSLLKFMKNLTNNLKITKRSEKQIQSQPKFEQTQKKINFKPTILKKNIDLQKNETKINTIKNIKLGISFKEIQKDNQNLHQNSYKNDNPFYDSSEMELSSKNMVSQLKFSSKDQILENSLKFQSDRQIQTEKQNYFTERIQTSYRKKKIPKQLQPLKRIQTQKKIRFKNNNQKIDFVSEKFQQKSQNAQKNEQNQNSIESNYPFNRQQDHIHVTRVLKVSSSEKYSQEHINNK